MKIRQTETEIAMQADKTKFIFVSDAKTSSVGVLAHNYLAVHKLDICLFM